MDTLGNREKQNQDRFEEFQTREQHWLSTRGTPQRSHSLHSGKPGMTPSGLLDNAPVTIGSTFARIFNSAVCGNICAMYDGMKKALGPSATKIAPLKSTTSDIITEQGKQKES